MREKDARPVIAVLRKLAENEVDSDHVRFIENIIKDVKDDNDIKNIPDEVDESHVDIALDRLRHNKDIYSIIDREARFDDGVLPDPRTWGVEYKTGVYRNPIESREYETYEEIEFNPVIDDDRYELDEYKRRRNNLTIILNKT
jgi:hypothetical protein